MNQQISFGVFPRLLITTLMVAIVPIAASWYIDYKETTSRLTNQVEEELSAQAQRLVTHFDTWMDMNLHMMRQNASLDEMVSMDPARQTPILQAIAKEYDKWANSCYVMQLDGQNISRSNEGKLQNFADRDWFKGALSGPFGSSVQISRNFGRPTFTLAIAINNQRQQPIGVLALTSFSVNMSKLVTNTKIGETGFVYLLNDQGRVIAHYKESVFQGVTDFRKHPVVTELGNETKKKIIFIDDTTKKLTIAYSQKTKYGMIAVVQQDYDEAFAELKLTRYNALIILAVSLFLVITVSFIVTRALYRGLQAPHSQSKFAFFPRLFLSMIVIAAVPLTAIWFVNSKAALEQHAQHKDKQLSIESDTLVAYINTWLEMNLRMLHQNSVSDAMKSMNAKKQKPILLSFAKEYPWQIRAHVSKPNGDQVVRNDDEPLRNSADRIWLQQAANGAPFGTELVISKTDATAVWVLAVPILSHQEKVVGVLSSVSTLAELSNVITNARIGKMGAAFLLNEQGQLVTHQKKAFTQTVLDFSKHPTFTGLGEASKKKILFAQEDTSQQMMSYAQRTAFGWTLVVQQDYENGDVLAQQVGRNKLLVTLGVVIILSLLVSLRLSQSDAIRNFKSAKA